MYVLYRVNIAFKERGDLSSRLMVIKDTTYAVYNYIRMCQYRNALNILIVKATGNKPSGRPRWRSEDNSRIALKEIGISTRNCVVSAQDRGYWRALVNATLKLHKPWS